MLFNYKAVTQDSRTISGTAEAANRAALMALLHKQNVRPLSVEVAKGKPKSSLSSRKKKIKLADLVIFTRQLSTMVSAGVPLARSIASLQSNAENPYMREVLTSVTKDIESGMPLGDAFAKFPNVFGDVYVNMVRAGEEGGILDEILKRLATQVEQDASIRKKIRSAMMYPIVILGITVLSFFGIMLLIVPKIGAILKDLGGPEAKLPIYTEVLLKASNFCVSNEMINFIPLLNAVPIINKLPNLLFIMVFVAIGMRYLFRYIKTEKGKYKFHYLLLHTPIFKVVILKIAVARFSRTFASLMGAGVSVLDALEVTGAALGNKVLEAELKAAAIEVRNGKPLSDPISRSEYFPPIVCQMLLVGEETGQIDVVLVKIADFYEEEVSVLIDGLAAIIEPIMIVGLGGAVGLIAASVMGPIANLSKNIG